MGEVTFTKLGGALGAVVGGVHLDTIDDATFKEVADGLLEHQVLFFRDQHLSEDGHRALATRWGTPSVFPVGKHFGSTEILGYIEDTEDNPPKADDWHTDITWIAEPPQVAILCALEIPPYGGDTIWADLHGAWNALSPAMQAVLEPLQVRHSAGDGFWEAIGRVLGPDQLDEVRAAHPPVEHPLVRTHPHTGRKALFVAGGFMDSIVGMHPDESALLVDWLKARVEDPNLQVRWRWSPGDVAIWDERCTNHRALADHFPQRRRMRRCTVDGERPA